MGNTLSRYSLPSLFMRPCDGPLLSLPSPTPPSPYSLNRSLSTSSPLITSPKGAKTCRYR
ncbi:hypothetical protein EON63_13440 [archaeon]|nr:MAG: hypothetical protein EON63_13440 [archaeon]